MNKEEAYDAFDEIFRHFICGDSGCIFGRRGGMMTNGGCQTLKDPFTTRRALQRLVQMWRRCRVKVQS